MPISWFFRRNLDLSQATIRRSTEADITPVARLFREGIRRHYGFLGNELPGLLTKGYGVVVEFKAEIWGVAVVGPVVRQTSCLRGVALSGGIEQKATLHTLIPPLHENAQSHGIRYIFCSCDETTDAWLLSVLCQKGYIHDTDVLIYEKTTMDAPSQGNQAIHIRPACPSDIETIVALDHICFEPQWAKDQAVINAVISQGLFFIVAEVGSRVVGYAYASSHFEGQLAHLIRLAVAPSWRGQGIGVRLLAEIVSFARRQDTHLITLNTQSYNIAAQRLYHWFGFVATGDRHHIVRCDLEQ
jgi:[ribosomal protein S18]-alanine N-acetyltransferase